MMGYRKIAALAAGTALVLTAGCGKAAEKVAEKATEKALESESGNDTNVDFNTDDGSVEITDDEGNEFQVGSTDLPEDWPSELDPPDSVTITGSSTVNDGDSANMTVTAEASGDAEQLFEGLKTQLTDAGYSIDQNTTSSSNGGTYSSVTASDDSYAVSATVSSDGSDQITILMSVTETP